MQGACWVGPVEIWWAKISAGLQIYVSQAPGHGQGGHGPVSAPGAGGEKHDVLLGDIVLATQ